MQVLVVNCGSSSVKIDLIDPETRERKGKIRIERISADQNHEQVIREALPELLKEKKVDVIAHRVVHGGDSFQSAALVTDEVEAKIGELSKLAPLHNPANLAGIRAVKALGIDAPNVAVFDTAFHATLPSRAKHYAIDNKLALEMGLRRYGFHGPSHKWISQQAGEFLGTSSEELCIVTCHLGSGASVCAVEYGRSIETSMGMTPLEGLVMGTRCGDLDPGILLELLRSKRLSLDELDTMLNRNSGLAGLSGIGSDLRDIEDKAAEGDPACRLAIQVFAHRVRKYIGAYSAVMGRVDAIVFSGGIGENSALMRHRIAQRFDYLGARLDEDRNRELKLSEAQGVAKFSSDSSRVALLAIATDEACSIARDAADLIGRTTPSQELRVPVAISARHVHLTHEARKILFGQDSKLTPYKPLSQPGQFACEERVNLIGPKGRIDRVRVLGPERPGCQVEVSTTDEFKLGVDAPVRNSGDIKNSAGITLEGPAGTLTLEQGLICARRHIHMHPDDAERFGVRDKDIVEVALDSDLRDLIFADVLVRVKDSYRLEMHIDTDEANAAGIKSGHQGALVDTDHSVRIRSRL